VLRLITQKGILVPRRSQFGHLVIGSLVILLLNATNVGTYCFILENPSITYDLLDLRQPQINLVTLKSSLWYLRLYGDHFYISTLNINILTLRALFDSSIHILTKWLPFF